MSAVRRASTAGRRAREPAGRCSLRARLLAVSTLTAAADTALRTRLAHKPTVKGYSKHTYKV